MILTIAVDLDYDVPDPCDILLQIEAAHGGDQIVSDATTELGATPILSRIGGDDGVGERIWLRPTDRLRCAYRATVAIDRVAVDLAGLETTEPRDLPAAVVGYLMPSRFCPSDQFQTFVAAEFGDLAGGTKVAAIRDWIADSFTYVSGSSGAQTSAKDSFVQRQGVCRDYAHVLITLCRAATIPARFASDYAAPVDPPDFHAVAEVFLGGAWHLVDATGMATADGMAVIGVGRDAADVAFMTSYGGVAMRGQTVSVTAMNRPERRISAFGAR